MSTINPNSKLHRKNKPTTRCQFGKENKAALSSGGPAAFGFLSQQFLPITFTENKQRNWVNIETDFIRSAKNLCQLYNIEMSFDLSIDFPVNIATTYQILKEKLGKINSSIFLIITEHKSKTTLTTVAPLPMGRDLYYVPLNALEDFHKRKNKPCFDLLLSIFGYLNKYARLPLICENDYLRGCYESICEWAISVDHDLDEEDYNSYCSQIKGMQKKISILENAVLNPIHLFAFNQRLKSFRGRTELEKRLKKVATKFYTLYQEYPTNNFHKNISSNHLLGEEGERAYSDHYFSFFYDDSGWIHDQLLDYVNCDLQEITDFEVPVSIQYFDQLQKAVKCPLPYETKLLELMLELCSILYTYRNEKHYNRIYQSTSAI